MTVRLARARPVRRLTLVPLIDVLFILLVYFMVTSVYLDLDMISVARSASEESGRFGAPAPAERRTLLIRVAPDGAAVLRGQALTDAALAAARDTGARVLVLPSAEAPLQGLVGVLDRLSAAGITDARLVRLEARR